MLFFINKEIKVIPIPEELEEGEEPDPMWKTPPIEKMEFRLKKVNYIDVKQNNNVISDAFIVSDICKPRQAKRIFRRPFVSRVRTPWSLPISIFWEYSKKKDTPVNFYLILSE
jgi:hypothetical protein